MKKILAVLFAIVTLFTFASCGNTSSEPEENTVPVLEGVSAPVDILSTVWNTYADDEKFFAMGGSATAPVDGAPGEVDVTDTDTLTYNLICSADAQALIDGAASLIHAMNANTFTAGCYRLSEVANKTAFIEAMKTSVSGNQWMCGFPEKLLIVSIDNYVVVSFGAADISENFKTKLLAAYEIAVVEADEAIA